MHRFELLIGWIVSRYDDAVSVLRDGARFSCQAQTATIDVLSVSCVPWAVATLARRAEFSGARDKLFQPARQSRSGVDRFNRDR